LRLTGDLQKVVAAMHELVSSELFNQAVMHLDRIAKTRGWVFHELKYPIIDCEFQREGKIPLRLKIKCDNWDEQPPSITLLEADGTPLKHIQNSTGVFNTSPHTVTGQAFVCMRGTREYHTHESHLTDIWESIKAQDKYTIGNIITQIWRDWQESVN
jgi:hypothetical protein